MQRLTNNFRLSAAIFITILSVVSHAYADGGDTSRQVLKPGMTLVKATPSVSQPLGSLAPLPVESVVPSAALIFQDLLFKNPNNSKLPESGGMDASIVQSGPNGPTAMPAPTANFEGISNNDNAVKVYPPDTQGDIGYDPATGKKYYVQWVNLSFQIWDVTDPAAPVSVYGPAAGNTLWTGSGSVCESHNDGDPLTRFDSISRRWVMSQFTYTPNPPYDFHQCVAVSAGADPTGAWYLYDFPISTTVINDYSKIGIWPDGYYMSFNQFDGATFDYKGVGAVAFERAAMLAGVPARMIYIDVGATNPDFFGMLPSDLDGAPPTAGTPNYFAEWDDSTALGDTWDTLRIWEFHVDWTTPANSTFGVGSTHLPNRLIPTANVDPELCNLANNICIPQPGTGQKLDAISDRLMYRLQYRNFGDHQTLVGNHTVDASGVDRAGIHWFELRNTGSGFAMYQQGVYAPGSDNRWMGSAAMDVSGDIALGYSVSSSSTTYPSIRYTGRLETDPLGSLPQGEVSLIEGNGSQTGTYGRWGDYSMMAVDPADGCTFWYTQEHIQTTGATTWQTRIGSFRFPGCTPLPPGVLSGTVTTGGSTPVAGATVRATGVNNYSTVTDGTGHYSFNPESGTYDVTVSKYGYVTATATGVVVSGPAATTQNFTLTALANSTISGVVRDARTNWPLYARINIAGYPSGPVYNNPVTGAYSVVLANGPYTFNVTAMSGGYTALSQPVTVSTSATQNLSLAVDVGACSAPGYQPVTGSTLFTENFDAPAPPALPSGWGVADVSGTAGNWATSTATVHPSGVLPHSPPNLAYFNSWTASPGEQALLYRPNGIDLSGQTGAYVTFWMYHDTGYSSSNDTVQVAASTDGTTYYIVGPAIPRYTGATGWARHAVDISAYTGTGKTNVRIGLLATSAYGNDIHIDDLNITTPTCNPIASGGLVIGAVKDANTGTAIPNGTVKDSGNYPAVMIDSSADHARPTRMYVIGQPAGPVTLVASAPDYQTGQATVQVLAGNTVGRDIQLAAGRFSATPASLSFTVTKDAPSLSQPFSLKNNGGISADYRIFAISGVYTPPLAAGPFAEKTVKEETNNLTGPDASGLSLVPAPTGTVALAGGDVSRTIDITGLSIPWGIGFNTSAGDFWLGDFFNDRDYRFTASGASTGDSIDLAPWAFPYYVADMTYNPFTNRLWQVHVSGDNCIYELDPVLKVSTGNKICPLFGNSERGLAFDPVTDTYYAGSWTDKIINHFAPDGTILDTKATGLDISGLAINPVTGHLFVMTNINNVTDPLKFDVYVLDTKSSYANLGGFNLTSGGAKAFANYAQAGLEMDCDGNLWAVDQLAKKVYVAPSGETGACGWKAAWLSATPSSGTVTAGGTTSLVAGVNATAVSEGVHNGYLRVENSTPYGSVIVPVTLTVKSKLTVTRSGTGSGTVISSPSGINCGADCTEQYLPNTVVSLSAAAATYSTFTRWSGNPDCADGVVTLDTSKTCTAVFTVTPIRIPDQYSTIQAAYNALLNNGSIQSLVRNYIENVHFNRTINATLSGGFSPDWTAATGMTTIQGSLAIEKGSAILTNIIIK
jgi:hypothetical protein